MPLTPGPLSLVPGHMARRDTNFYYAFLALPASRRHAIMAAWDFFRAVDDSVDEAGAADSPEALVAARERVAIWRRELAACYEGGPLETPQAAALVAHIRRFHLPREAFAAVIDGVEMDLTQREWATFEDLRQYCLRVASAVGLVCIEIFGYTNPVCRQYAIDLGIALQLTNILRDIGKDLRGGRLYIPQEDLNRFGVTRRDFEAGVITDKVRALLEFQARRAHAFFEKADAELPLVDAPGFVSARIMGAIYWKLLRRIERSGYAVLGTPIRIPRWQKVVIAVETWVSTEMGLP
jgi:15-cis-phytoene synthase